MEGRKTDWISECLQEQCLKMTPQIHFIPFLQAGEVAVNNIYMKVFILTVLRSFQELYCRGR